MTTLRTRACAIKGARELQFLQLGEAGPSGLKALKDLPRLDHLAVDAVKVVPGRVDLSAMEGVTWLEIGHFVGSGPRYRLPLASNVLTSPA